MRGLVHHANMGGISMTTTDKVELAEVEGRLIQQMATERSIMTERINQVEVSLRQDMASMESRLTERIDGVDSGLRTELIHLGRSLSSEIQTVNNRVNSLEGKVDQILKKLGD